MNRPSAAGIRHAASSRHFITGLGIGQITSWGTLYYSFPLIGEAMGQDLGWSKSEIFLAATIGLLLAAPAAYPIGLLIDRGFGRAIMAGASMLAAAAFLGWSQVTSLPFFYALVALIGILQAAVLYEPAFAVVARRVGPANARNGITTLTFWGGFASTVFIPLIQILMDHFGWRGALVALAVVNIGIALLYALVIDRNLDAAPEVSEGVANAAGSNGNRPVLEAMRRPVFWLLGFAFTAYAGTFSAFTFHLYPLLLEKGLTAPEVVTAMMMIGPAQVALALVALYGLANGIMTIVRGMAIPEMLSRSNYGALNGALSMPATLVKALAPGAAAMLWQASGSYDTVLGVALFGACLLVASFWLAALVSRRETRPA